MRSRNGSSCHHGQCPGYARNTPTQIVGVVTSGSRGWRCDRQPLTCLIRDSTYPKLYHAFNGKRSGQILLESARCHYGRGPEQRPWTSHLEHPSPKEMAYLGTGGAFGYERAKTASQTALVRLCRLHGPSTDVHRSRVGCEIVHRLCHAKRWKGPAGRCRTVRLVARGARSRV